MGRLLSLFHAVLPPMFQSLFERKMYYGNYSSWDEARSESNGYDSDVIITKVRDALLKVKRGEAVYERDSVLFDHIQYSFPVLSGLLRAALEDGGRLHVLDFGGSLGSSYYQNREFLKVCHDLRWCIIEQEKFVTIGRESFQDDQLKFYYSLNECMEVETPNVVLLSGVLQSIENPYEVLREIISYRIKYVIIDRTTVTDSARDYLTVHRVPPEIFPASFPQWVLSEQQILAIFKGTYIQLVSTDSWDNAVIHLDGFSVLSRCYILKLES
jgi:putative methyltransferase (TIGR04325 family)